MDGGLEGWKDGGLEKQIVISELKPIFITI
jgi:hypothetical protein